MGVQGFQEFVEKRCPGAVVPVDLLKLARAAGVRGGPPCCGLASYLQPLPGPYPPPLAAHSQHAPGLASVAHSQHASGLAAHSQHAPGLATVAAHSQHALGLAAHSQHAPGLASVTHSQHAPGLATVAAHSQHAPGLAAHSQHAPGLASVTHSQHAPGLVTVAAHSQHAPGLVTACPARLLVDADSALQRLYGGYQTDWVCGGQWNAMVGYLAALSQACLYQGGLELAVIFNGGLGKERLPEWGRKAQAERQTAQLIAGHVGNKGTPPPRAWFLPPACLGHCVRLAMIRFRVKVFQSLEDHHLEVVSFFRERGFHGLLAHDSEFALASLPCYFSAHALKLSWNGKSLTTNQFLMHQVAKQLGLKVSSFPVFAALLGNHILPDEDLAAFHWSLLGPDHPLASLKVRAHQLVLPPCDVVIKAVSEYVSAIKDPCNLDAVGRDVFKHSQSRTEDKIERFKKAVNYYSVAAKMPPAPVGPSSFEWAAYKGKSPQTPELVSALAFREWTCPNLRKLWLGKAVEDKNRRMRAFLACLRADTPGMLNPASVPTHLLLLCCVLRYMMQWPGGRILHRHELDVFLAQAVSSQLYEPDHLQELKTEQAAKVERMRQSILEGVNFNRQAPPPLLPPPPFVPAMAAPFYSMPLYPRTTGSVPPPTPGRSRGFTGLHPIPPQGGKLEIAGMVVGQWAGSKPSRGRGSFGMQVVSVGGPGKGDTDPCSDEGQYCGRLAQEVDRGPNAKLPLPALQKEE
ncbi:hypothetical protein KIL84_012404 [Mauremys mutica]|uniref:Constitutive coactivator of PPAR-gamma-like protein 2 n=1 Tax=Mauremys mutica TaxID=74926 RepID=A0A9D3XZ01_9SAUR|nr:hypothetical protein KIL84_012404 [Mauremys mutica]